MWTRIGGQAAAQEHIRRLGDCGRNSGQELVAYSTWPSLSSAEEEYYAIVTGAAEALAVQALAEELAGRCLSEFTQTRLTPRQWRLGVVWGNCDPSS